MHILLTVPAIVALTNLAKRTGLPAKLAPLVSVLVGVAVACGDAYSTGAGYLDAAARGIILGLTASGLYDLMPGTPKGSTVNVYGKDSVRGRHSATTGAADADDDPIEPDAPTPAPAPAPEPKLDAAAAAAAHVASLPAPAPTPTETREALRGE